jgi:hypothetical protein
MNNWSNKITKRHCLLINKQVQLSGKAFDIFGNLPVWILGRKPAIVRQRLHKFPRSLLQTTKCFFGIPSRLTLHSKFIHLIRFYLLQLIWCHVEPANDLFMLTAYQITCHYARTALSFRRPFRCNTVRWCRIPTYRQWVQHSTRKWCRTHASSNRQDPIDIDLRLEALSSKWFIFALPFRYDPDVRLSQIQLSLFP